MANELILVTGSSGRIGQAVVRELQGRGRCVRGFDLVATPNLPDLVIGTLTDPAAVARAMHGVHTLIHLAATPDDNDFLTHIVPNNIIGVHHVLEAAHAAAVKRMILASSGQVVWYDRMRTRTPLGVDAAPTPRYWYAAAKMFLEGAGRAFHEKFGMEVIAVRLGWCPRTPEQVEEIRVTDWAQDVYLSPNDAGRFFACAALAPGPIGFQVVYATSKPVHWLRYDLEPANRLFGFAPQEQWPQGIEIVLGKNERGA
ncbi:MAG: NAD(P)-dependent oxidoreductase [Gemmataceae bacterium]|nr:NAD(P)-dependent oxidoreductase [Gemmataceae bacterium]